MREISETLRDLRESRKLRQRQVAEYLKCTQGCYSHYEKDKREVPTSVLIKLCYYYGTSVDYLLGLTDKKDPYPRKESV